MKLALLALVLASVELAETPVATPVANEVVVIVLDSFGRPVPGLEIEALLRAKDGGLKPRREATAAKTGRVRLDLGSRALADVDVLGSYKVVGRTNWSQAGDTYVLLTVAPRIEYDIAFRAADGSPTPDVAVLVRNVDWRSSTALFHDGEGQTDCAALSGADGVVHLSAHRGCNDITAVVPGAFPFTPMSGVQWNGLDLRVDGAHFVDARGGRFELRVPMLSPRPIQWLASEDVPDPTVSWFPAHAALEALPGYAERFSAPADENGITQVLEPIREGDLLRLYGDLMAIRRGKQEYRLGVPPVPEKGLTAELSDPLVGIAPPAAPKGFVFTWRSYDDYDVRKRIAPGETFELTSGSNSLWASPIGASDIEHLVRIDTSVGGAIDTPVEYTRRKSAVDITALPKGRWALQSFTVLVDEDDAYVDVNDWVVLDDQGRAETFGTLSAETSSLQPAGTGLASMELELEDKGDGTFAPVAPGGAVAIEFVNPDGSPAPFVHFVARAWSPGAFFRMPDTLPAWSNEKGQAILLLDLEKGQRPIVTIAPVENLPGTVLLPTGEGTLRYVVPARGRLAIDAAALAGGDKRPLRVRLARAVEGDTSDVGDRVDCSPVYLTTVDGTLVVDDIAAGDYLVEIADIGPSFRAIGGARPITVAAQKP